MSSGVVDAAMVPMLTRLLVRWEAVGDGWHGPAVFGRVSVHGGWGDFLWVAIQLACPCEVKGVSSASPRVWVGACFSVYSVPVGTGLVSWRRYVGWLVKVVLGAVGACFSWACVGAAASILFFSNLFPEVSMHVPACIMMMLMAVSVSFLRMYWPVLISLSLLLLCLPLNDDAVFLLLDGVCVHSRVVCRKGSTRKTLFTSSWASLPGFLLLFWVVFVWVWHSSPL